VCQLISAFLQIDPVDERAGRRTKDRKEPKELAKPPKKSIKKDQEIERKPLVGKEKSKSSRKASSSSEDTDGE
jgi:hypothetical protein